MDPRTRLVHDLKISAKEGKEIGRKTENARCMNNDVIRGCEQASFTTTREILRHFRDSWGSLKTDRTFHFFVNISTLALRCKIRNFHGVSSQAALPRVSGHVLIFFLVLSVS